MPRPRNMRLDANHMSGKDQGCHTPELPPLSGDTGPPPRRVFVFLGCEVSPIIPNHAGYIGSGDSDRGCTSTILPWRGRWRAISDRALPSMGRSERRSAGFLRIFPRQQSINQANPFSVPDYARGMPDVFAGDRSCCDRGRRLAG